MKKYLSILALAALTACSNEEDFSFNPNEIRLTSSVNSMTRVNSFDVQSTQIESGQQVGVKIEGAESEHSNIAWTVGNNGELTTNDPICWGAGNITVYAYHPYNSGVDFNNSFDFHVSDDQTDDGYKNSDLMWASTTSPQTTEAVELNFTHKLSKINVVLENSSESDVNLNNATITICNVNRATTFEPWSGHFYNEFESGEILAGTATNQASAIIVPQYISSGKKFIKIEAEGKTYYYTLNNDKQFESGMVYTFRLSIKASVVVSLSETVTNWADGGTTEGGLTEYVDPAKDSKIPFDANLTELTYNGVLTGTEIYVLRRMMGAYPFDESEWGNLQKLDISGATIEAGGIPYYYINGKNPVYTENNMVTEHMFFDCNKLQEISLPTGITGIESAGFYGCGNLQKITLPEGLLTIGSQAFDCCGQLNSIKLPASLQEIGWSAFASTSLETIEIAEASEWLSVEDNVLYDKNKTVIHYCPRSKTTYTCPTTITKIAAVAFRSTQITYLELPEGLEEIEWSAFSNTPLTSIKLPSTLTKIANQVFEDCRQLQNVTIPDNLKIVDGWIFSGCTALKEVTIGSGVEEIYSGAFADAPIETMHCRATTPPTLAGDWAGEINSENPEWSNYKISSTATLYVPTGSAEIYKEKGWEQYFAYIIEE